MFWPVTISTALEITRDSHRELHPRRFGECCRACRVGQLTRAATGLAARSFDRCACTWACNSGMDSPSSGEASQPSREISLPLRRFHPFHAGSRSPRVFGQYHRRSHGRPGGADFDERLGQSSSGLALGIPPVQRTIRARDRGHDGSHIYWHADPALSPGTPEELREYKKGQQPAADLPHISLIMLRDHGYD